MDVLTLVLGVGLGAATSFLCEPVVASFWTIPRTRALVRADAEEVLTSKLAAIEAKLDDLKPGVFKGGDPASAAEKRWAKERAREAEEAVVLAGIKTWLTEHMGPAVAEGMFKLVPQDLLDKAVVLGESGWPRIIVPWFNAARKHMGATDQARTESTPTTW